MARNDTIFERFLAPFVKTFLIDEDKLRRFHESIDWQAASTRLSDRTLTYPTYYSSQNFHGIEGGYLNVSAAVSYDPITQYALPPGEALVRQSLLDAIQSQPRRILDLGCGTGSTTLLLKQAFPEAEVIGLDLSPQMLVVAEHKAEQANLAIQWRHGNAEHTHFPDASFDLVTASLLFHETPPTVSQAILRECYRLLTVGGEVVILDGNQKVLRQTEWLTQIFEEPYIQAFASGSVDAWMGAAQFEAVQTHDRWLIHQVTRGVKPLPYKAVEFSLPTYAAAAGDRPWVSS
ncbi:methyltransferase domain-containing protein [Phormidium sp. FACHB-592]|uniref:Methyltransferase domain-containing protein n=1 Tax=Stenomitos frigidus AS-A4 TaxID=2933935 RepID=A0ABV0KNS0_9CYAN|nr:class I SAM-dependent methyltransferase [Phormidium sp. FACHB-592]MBD2073026.1 methyltransferase domain-containing protein [Phormidium sp. FACHB-592]